MNIFAKLRPASRGKGTKEKKVVKAVAEQQNMPHKQKKPARLFAEGKALLAQKQFVPAWEAFDEAMRLGGENAFCRATMSRALYQVGSREETEAFLRRSLELSPDSSLYLAELARFLGKRQNNEPVLREAIALYRKALAREKDGLKTQLAIGDLLLKIPSAKEAEEHFGMIGRTCPGRTEHLYGYVRALNLQLRFAEALPFAEEAMKASPDHAQMALQLGDIYSALGRHEDAARLFQDFIGAHPQHTARLQPLITVNNQRAGIFTPEESRHLFFSRNFYLKNRPELTSVQKRLVESLFDTGIAVTHVEELLDDGDLGIYEAADRQVMDFRSRPEVVALCGNISSSEKFEDDPNFQNQNRVKPYIAYYHLIAGPLRARDPIARLMAHRRIIEIANAYNETLVKVCNMNLWINPPLRGKNLGSRRGSQKWHRDQDDLKNVKCFIYMTDLDEKSGSLEFIPQSNITATGKYRDFFPYPHSLGCPGDHHVDAVVPQGDRVRVVCKKGGIALVDTNGFHRGGLVETTERRMLMATYLNPAAQHLPNSMRPVLDGFDPGGLTDAELYALT